MADPRGKLADAAELLDGAIEAARLLGSPPALAGNFFNRSAVALAAGDLETALATAEEGVELTRDLDDGFVAAWAAVRLAAVLLETGQPERAAELLTARGQYYDLYTRQYAFESNLFLAPGEGDTQPEEEHDSTAGLRAPSLSQALRGRLN